MSWDELPRMTRRRYHHHLVLHQDRVWAIGGSGREPVSECESWGEDGWRSEASFSVGRIASTRVLHDGNHWFVGGLGGTKATEPRREVDVLVEGVFQRGPDLPVPLGSCAAFALHNGALAIAGGRTRGGVVGDCYWLDGEEWRQGPQLLSARAGHHVIRAGGLVWVIGGSDLVEVLEGGRFVEAGSLGGFREALQVCPLQDGVWLGGGLDERGQPCREAWVLDAEGLHPASPLPEPLAGAAVSVATGQLVGGMRSSVMAGATVRDVRTGRARDALPVAVAHHAALDLPSGEVLVSGGLVMAAGGVSNRCFRSRRAAAFPM